MSSYQHYINSYPWIIEETFLQVFLDILKKYFFGSQWLEGSGAIKFAVLICLVLYDKIRSYAFFSDLMIVLILWLYWSYYCTDDLMNCTDLIPYDFTD